MNVKSILRNKMVCMFDLLKWKYVIPFFWHEPRTSVGKRRRVLSLQAASSRTLHQKPVVRMLCLLLRPLIELVVCIEI